MPETRLQKTQAPTHYAEWDAPQNGSLRKAVCGVWIRQKENAGPAEPTCKDCQQRLKEANDLHF